MRRYLGCLTTLIALAIGPAAAAQTQVPTVDQQLAEMRARLDALERENSLLRQSLTETDGPAPGPLFSPPPQEGEQPSQATDIEHRLAELEAKFAANQEYAASEACPCETGAAKDKEDALEMHASWHHGFEVATKDRDYRVHVGGRTQMDVGWFDAPENVQENINMPYEDGADFRRARIRVDGTLDGWIEFAAEYDFVNSMRVDNQDRALTAPTDLWWIFNDLPVVGHVRVGNQKAPIGFEHMSSSRFLPFMERSYNMDSFYGGTYNGFWPGVSAFDAYGDDQDGTWTVGVYKPTNNAFAASAHDGDYATTARLTRLVWYDCEGERLLHVGMSAQQQTTVADRMIFRTRDAVRTGLSASWPQPATTGTLAGNDMQWINGEIAAVHGPYTFQAEYLASYMTDASTVVGNVVQPSVGDVLYHGGYIQGFYFLTGEHETYDKLLAVFTRVTPKENANCSVDECGQRRGGIGAWQVGARYNYLDLNDNGINGGILHNGTVGLNWFLNPNMKIQFNYMLTHRDAALTGELGDGWIQGWGMRFAQDF